MLRTDLNDGATNGLAVINALLDALGLSRNTNQKIALVQKTIQHHAGQFPDGIDGLTNDQLGSAFCDLIIADLKAKLRATGRADGIAAAQAAIDAAADEAEGLME